MVSIIAYVPIKPLSRFETLFTTIPVLTASNGLTYHLKHRTPSLQAVNLSLWFGAIQNNNFCPFT